MAILFIEGCLFCFNSEIKAESKSGDNADSVVDVQSEEEIIKSVIAEYALAMQSHDFKKVYTELLSNAATRSKKLEEFILIAEINAVKEKITGCNIDKIKLINQFSAKAIIVVNFEDIEGKRMFRTLTINLLSEKTKGKKEVSLEREWKIKDLVQDSDALDYQMQLLRNIYIQNHPELNLRIRDAIEAGQVFIGMSQDEVVASWGEAFSKSYYISSSGRTDKWNYGGKTLNFFNGKLSSIFSHDD